MVDIKNSDDLREWLKGKPIEFSVVIASRVALRVLPLLNDLFEAGNIEADYLTDIFQPTLRAMFTSEVAGKYPASAKSIARTAVYASRAVDIVDAVDVVSEVAFAAIYAVVNSADSTYVAEVANATGFAAEVASRFVTVINVANSAAFIDAYVADANSLDQGMSPEYLARQPLWGGGQPDDLGKMWRGLKRNLLALDEDWQVWTDWYEDVLAGRNRAGLPDDLVEELDLKIALQENDWWERGPAKVNGDIAAWTEAALAEAGTKDGLGMDGELIAGEVDNIVPPLKPATVQPIWKSSKLVQSTALVETKLSEHVLSSYAEAIRRELLTLVEAVSEADNFDARALDYFIETANLLPDGSLNSSLLFQLTMRSSLLLDQIPKIEDEWPDFLAARFRLLCDDLDEYLSRYALRREFDRDVLEGSFEGVDLDSFGKDINQFIEVMRSEPISKVIESSIPNALESIGTGIAQDPNESALPVPLSSKTSIVVASDKAESVNNVAKELLRAVGIEEGADALLKEGNEAYSKGLKDNYLMASYEAGAVEANKLAKAINRGAVAEGVIRSRLDKFAKKYPKIVGWMKQ